MDEAHVGSDKRGDDCDNAERDEEGRLLPLPQAHDACPRAKGRGAPQLRVASSLELGEEVHDELGQPLDCPRVRSSCVLDELELRLREALGEALPHRNWEKAIIATQAIGTGCGSRRRVW